MVLAVIVTDPDEIVIFLATDGEGAFGLYPIDDLIVDWRYDPASGVWSDVNELGSDLGDEG